MALVSPPKRASLLRALGHRNYRLFFFGQGTSLVGTWMSRIATSWLVYRLTGDPVLLGVVGFAGQVPTALLGPLAGVWVDRWDRRRLLIGTQVASFVQSLLLVAVALSPLSTPQVVTALIALNLAQGAISAFDMPTRQVFLMQIIRDPSHLPNAIALNSSLVHGARLLGPSLAGFIIGLWGEAWCFLIDALSYLAVIAALYAIRLERVPRRPEPKRVWESLKEGLGYAFGFAPVRALLLLTAVVGFGGMPQMVLLPAFAKDVLGGDAHVYGILTAASGLGALSGALYLASRDSVEGMGKLIAAMVVTLGVGLVLFGLSRTLWLATILSALTGMAMIVQMAASNIILQSLVDESILGRVMSLFTLAFMGTAPFASLAAGFLGARIGVPATLSACGVLCLAASAWFLWRLPGLRAQARPVLVDRGILPEVARGLQQSAHLSRPSET